MRIPKVYRRDDNEKEKNKITYIDITSEQFDPIIYTPDVDFDDDKSVRRYVKTIKSITRQSREYKRLMQFLKTKCGMNECFFLPKLKKYRDSKISINIHHTGLVMEDIIMAVLKKRYAEGQSYDCNSVAEEVMYQHYVGNISLTALSATMHELIHEEDSELFIPLQMVDFGNIQLFYEEYKDYIEKDTIKKFEQYKLLSEAVENIENIIPDYLDVSYIYYNKEGVSIPDMDKILEIIDLKD